MLGEQKRTGAAARRLRREVVPTPRLSRSLVEGQLHGSLQKPHRVPGCPAPPRDLGLVWICSVS